MSGDSIYVNRSTAYSELSRPITQIETLLRQIDAPGLASCRNGSPFPNAGHSSSFAKVLVQIQASTVELYQLVARIQAFHKMAF